MALTIAYILNQWQTAGVFDYILPFLLVFAIVFGILASTNILGSQKGVNVIIALVVGLLSIRLGLVQRFFTELFPRLGVGLAVILALLILTGLFISDDETRYWLWGFATVGVIIWFIIIIGSFNNFSWFGGYGGFVEDYAGLIIGAVLLIGVIIAISASKSSGTPGTGKAQRQVFHPGS